MGTVIEYPGKRGTTFRLKYKDASGKRVTETLPKGTTAKGAKEALRDRESDVSRIGYALFGITLSRSSASSRRPKLRWSALRSTSRRRCEPDCRRAVSN